MAGDAEDIQREFERQREALGRNVQELQYRMRSMVNWRDQYAQHPWAGASLAFAGGVLISALAFRKHSSNGGPERRTHALLDNIASALSAVAAVYAKEFLNAAVPGFREEFERRASYRSR